MYASASGKQSLPSAAASRRTHLPPSPEITSRDAAKFKVFFPSARTVRTSRGGSGYVFPCLPETTVRQYAK